MIKKIILFSSLFVLVVKTSLFAQMAELPFAEKVQKSSDIFEGKVVRKTCFWNDKHTLIFTANTVEVYKVFKGNIKSTEVDIITEGGTIGNDMQRAESGLSLKEGYVGVFLTEPANAQTNGNKTPAYKVYGSSQGFIKYDLIEKTASDPFKKYGNIQNDFYKVLNEQTTQSFREIKSFNVDQPSGNKVKKESFCARHCKKRKAKKEQKK